MNPTKITFLLSLILGFILPVSAQKPGAPQKPGAGFGVTSALTLQAVKFQKVDMTATALQRMSFPATFSVRNRTGKAIPMQFPSADDSQAQIEFRLLDESGTVLWDTRPLLRPVGDALPRGAAWHRTAQIPLTVDSQPLAAGRYTVEAEVLGRPRFLSQAEFEVFGPGGLTGCVIVFSNVHLSAAEVTVDEANGLVHLSAVGSVNSGGWSNPRLRPCQRLTASPPLDGIYDFAFTAEPPGKDMAVIMAFQPISASLSFPLPLNFKGVRVHGQAATLTATPKAQ